LTDEQKERAIHDWLIDNSEYDHPAFEYHETHDKSIKGYEDSYSAYGILIKGIGVCNGCV
jgi:transglutaminase/protease-like cytokinesis protein 3